MSDQDDDAGESRAQATLKLYVDLTNSERQAIWARTAAMLVANSFIITAIRLGPANADAPSVTLFSWAGIGICLLWGIMAWRGWEIAHGYMEAANRLPLRPPSNPFHHLGAVGFNGDYIFWCTIAIIGIFIVLYWVMLASLYMRLIALAWIFLVALVCYFCSARHP